MSTYQIPEEFLSDLEVVQPKDLRPDAHILTSLRKHHPVTSERNIWAYWHGGIDDLPPWCLRNVLDWVRICGPSWTIRVVDRVPGSGNHWSKYVPEEMLPKTFVEGTMTGPYTGPHSADFLRGALLYLHGGVNLDVGCILMRDMDRMFWAKLEDEKSPYEVAVPVMYGEVIANHMVAARKGNPFIKRWHDLFTHLWADRTTWEGLSDSPLLAFVKEITDPDSDTEGFNWDWKAPFTTVLEYITQVSCWRRLCMLEGNSTTSTFSGCDYWMKHILCTDVRQENWGAEAVLGFDKFGPRIFDLLQVKVDGDRDSKEWKEAYEVVWRVLRKSSVQKVTRGKNLTHSIHVGSLWDENPGTDCLPGTFGELLRYGSVNYRQKRKEVVTLEPKRPKVTMTKGLLEA